MGVELGKVLAKNILAQLETPADVKGHDSSVRILFIVPCLELILTLSRIDDRPHPLLPEVQERVNLNVSITDVR